MKNKIFLILLMHVNLVWAQSPLTIQWDNSYGGIGNDIPTSFQQTSDGGYILGGTTASDSSGNILQHSRDTSGNWMSGTFHGDYWIVKTDASGNLQWEKRFGGFMSDDLTCVKQCPDGGYILGGSSYSGIGGDKSQPNWDTTTNAARRDYWLIKTDSIGNLQWEKRFGGINDDQLMSVELTSDHGFILCGFSASDSSGDKTQSVCNPSQSNYDFWIVKTDSLGIKQWDKDFGGNELDFYKTIIHRTIDGGYIIGGTSTSGIGCNKTDSLRDTLTTSTSFRGDYWILKIDSAGSLLWDKTFGGASVEWMVDLIETADGGFLIGGYTLSDSSGDVTQPGRDSSNTWYYRSDYWVVKTDAQGNKLWDKRFGGSAIDYLASVFQASDGGYIISGGSLSGISGDKTENHLRYFETWIIKTDSSGNIQWDKTINGGKMGRTIEVSDGCYLILSEAVNGIDGYNTHPNWDTSSVNPTSDFWLAKFCDTTLVTSINQITNTKLPFSIYPNPTSSLINFALANNENIIITNVFGEIVLQKKAKGKVELDVSFLSAGIYFIKAGNEISKFVKE